MKVSKTLPPIIETSEIRAKTVARNDIKYTDASDETSMPTTMNILVALTIISPDNFLYPESSVPSAKAEESIVPMKAAIKDTVRRDLSHEGSDGSSPCVKSNDGSMVVPPIL